MVCFLIADDSLMMRSVVRNYILQALPDASFVEAGSGEEAVEKFKSEKPNIAFLDIMMSGMTGVEAAKQIKEYDQAAKVVMCTSMDEEKIRVQTDEIGVSGYIVKPFRQEEIKNVLSNLGFI